MLVLFSLAIFGYFVYVKFFRKPRDSNDKNDFWSNRSDSTLRINQTSWDEYNQRTTPRSWEITLVGDRRLNPVTRNVSENIQRDNRNGTYAIKLNSQIKLQRSSTKNYIKSYKSMLEYELEAEKEELKNYNLNDIKLTHDTDCTFYFPIRVSEYIRLCRKFKYKY